MDSDNIATISFVEDRVNKLLDAVENDGRLVGKDRSVTSSVAHKIIENAIELQNVRAKVNGNQSLMTEGEVCKSISYHVDVYLNRKDK